MNFFNNYIFRTFIVVAVLLISIPLVMPKQGVSITEGEEDYSSLPFKARAVKMIDKITSYYGIDELVPKSGAETKPAPAAAAQREAAAAITREEYEQRANTSSAEHDEAVQKFMALVREQAESSPRHQASGPGGSDSTYSIPIVYGKPNPNNIEPKAAEFNGKRYDVLDAHGVKYVIGLEKGPVELETILAQGGVYPAKTAAPAQTIITREEYEQRRSNPAAYAAQLAKASGAGRAEAFQSNQANAAYAGMGSNDFTASLSRASAAARGGAYSGDLSNKAEAAKKEPSVRSGATSTYGGQGGIMIRPAPQPAKPDTVAKSGQDGKSGSPYEHQTWEVSVPLKNPENPVLVFNMPTATVGTRAIENIKMSETKVVDDKNESFSSGSKGLLANGS